MDAGVHEAENGKTLSVPSETPLAKNCTEAMVAPGVEAEAEALTAQNALAAARLRVEESRGSMRRLAGNTLPLEFSGAGTLPPLPGLGPMEGLQREVLAAHPSLRALSADVERARQRLAQERALAMGLQGYDVISSKKWSRYVEESVAQIPYGLFEGT